MTAHDHADAGHQLARGERLDHVVVRAAVEARQLVVLLAPGGEHEHGGVPQRAQLPADGKAVHVGQHHVENDGVVGVFPAQAEGLPPAEGAVGAVTLVPGKASFRAPTISKEMQKNVNGA